MLRYSSVTLTVYVYFAYYVTVASRMTSVRGIKIGEFSLPLSSRARWLSRLRVGIAMQRSQGFELHQGLQKVQSAIA